METEKSVTEGLIWNYISIVILAVSGLIFELIIVLFYDATALGIFNESYAWYCILSQFAAAGIHMSVLSYVPIIKDTDEIHRCVATALFEVTIVSIIVVLLSEIIVAVCMSPDSELQKSMSILLPCLAFFAANKVLLNYLNAMSSMKAYAVFQALRYVFIILSVLAMSVLRIPRTYLAFALGSAEILLFGCLLSFLITGKLFYTKLDKKWLKEHLYFGVRVFPSNIVLELNAKVDIVCLGFLLADENKIGIYSFATLFSDGLYQIYIVIRRIINPKLAKAYDEKQLVDDITTFKIKYKKWMLGGMLIFLFMLLGGYSGMCVVLRKNEYLSGAIVILIIGMSIIATGMYIALGNIFSQAKQPEIESAINISTVSINIILNLLLIGKIGILGAAVGTAASYFYYGCITEYMMQKRIGTGC